MENERLAQTGCAVFVFNYNNKILLGKRISDIGIGDGKWQLPGGKLRHMESWDDCCKREVKEETNLDIEDVLFLTVINSRYEYADRHFVDCFFWTHECGGELKVTEPDKCSEWKWFDIEDIPYKSKTFLDLKSILAVHMDNCPFSKYNVDTKYTDAI